MSVIPLFLTSVASFIPTDLSSPTPIFYDLFYTILGRYNQGLFGVACALKPQNLDLATL